MTKEERLAKLKLVMKGINKTQKKEVLSFADTEVEWERVSTGIKELDDMIGGGFPRGHTSIVWGGSGSAKSTLMYSVITQAQKDDLIVVYLDLENSFLNERAMVMGVNTEDLVIGHYNIAEEALDTIIKLAKEGVVDVIILDSIHSMATKNAVEDKKGEKSLSTNTMGALAKKLSEFFARVSTHIFKSNISLIMIGQVRKNLGGFVVLDKLSGGNALIHNSVLTLHQRRGQKSNAPVIEWREAFLDPDGKFHLQKQKVEDGFETVIKIDKKKCSGGQNEGATISIPYYYDTGFIKPDLDDEVIKIDPTMNEEQVKNIKEKLVEKGYLEFAEETVMDDIEFESVSMVFNGKPDQPIKTSIKKDEFKNLPDDIKDYNVGNEITLEKDSDVINMVENSIDDLGEVMDVNEAKEKIKKLKEASDEKPKKRGRGRPKKEKK